jgi:CheY-like chemotaxis protein
MSTMEQKRIRSMTHRFATKPRPSDQRQRCQLSEAIQAIPCFSEVLRVLVVDDCKDTVDSTAMLLELWGYNVASAYDGRTALELASSYRPHVLLMETAMARGHGSPWVELLGQMPCLKEAIMVAITGNTSLQHRGFCEQAGFDYFFFKPVNLAIIKSLLFIENKQLTSTIVPQGSVATTYDQTPLQVELRAMIGECVGASSFHVIP